MQDEASQLVGEFVAAAPGERVLDACASPGGKTTQMAAAMGDTGTDRRGRRPRPPARPARRATVSESGAHASASSRPTRGASLPFGAVFDAVLLDAPCSGLGTIRRDPDISWRRTEADLERWPTPRADARRLAAVVRPGGRLIYSTCSSEPEENEDVVHAFLAGHPEFRRASPHSFTQNPELAGLLDGEGSLKTLPFRDGLEAFYAACLIRGPSDDELRTLTPDGAAAVHRRRAWCLWQWIIR